jgi:N-acetylneuraminic acid mutarotase
MADRRGRIFSSLFGLSVLLAPALVSGTTADSWIATSTVGAPAGRDGHVAVWTGDRMIVWGGTASDGSTFGNGAIYDPAARTWKAISGVGAPRPRADATVVWTGDRMLVWGGIDHANLGIGDGAAYDPETDTWTPISPAGAPSPRFFHTAVWTGTEMIVLGGFAKFVPGVSPTAFATGAAYDPAADAWRAISPTGAPPPRGGHVAVWTGDRMIVWGGSSGHGAIGGGGIYDPVTDSWTPTSTDGEPSGRVSHTGTWIRDRFIVWGGLLDIGKSTNTGASYDPVADAWTPIPLAGAPSPRDGHGAAELDGRLVVWSGGSSGQKFTVLNDGGIFDPRTGAWTPTTPSGAPSPRDGVSTVSTGRSVIFWGGFGSVSFATGGEYFPPFCTGGGRHCVADVPATAAAIVGGRP